MSVSLSLSVQFIPHSLLLRMRGMVDESSSLGSGGSWQLAGGCPAGSRKFHELAIPDHTFHTRRDVYNMKMSRFKYTPTTNTLYMYNYFEKQRMHTEFTRGFLVFTISRPRHETRNSRVRARVVCTTEGHRVNQVSILSINM